MSLPRPVDFLGVNHCMAESTLSSSVKMRVGGWTCIFFPEARGGQYPA